MLAVAFHLTINFIAVLVAIVVGVISILEAVHRATKGQNQKLQQIHVLVNSRLTEALEEVARLKKALGLEDPPSSV